MRVVAVFLVAIGLSACSGSSATTADPASTAAQPLARQMCEVCGMVVDEQPSPRGQLVHRDGTHLHFCSLGDMRIYLSAPSPRGKPVAMHVEDLPTSFDPAATDTVERPWIDATSAHYVVGFERAGIMGKPVATFSDRAAADQVAARVSGQVVSWEAWRAQKP